MKIIRLSAKNVKRLRAVEIKPDGNVVIVSGRNGQGKSSVLDSIAYALGGKDVICKQPVHRGQKRAEVVCDLGELIVKRTFTEDGGGTLTVESKDGAQFPKPQGKLDDLIGRLSFDPWEFVRKYARKQADTLRALVGLDFAELDAKRAALYQNRTEVNRDGKAMRARLDAMPDPFQDVPLAEVSSAEIVGEMEVAQQFNRGIAEEHRKAAEAKSAELLAESRLRNAKHRAHQTGEEIAALKERLEIEQREVNDLAAALGAAQTIAVSAKSHAESLAEADLRPINLRLAAVEETNRKVRHNAARTQLAKELDMQLRESGRLTRDIDAIDMEKQTAIAAASFPVTGLGFDADGGVTFGDLPLDQAAASELMTVSAAIGLAMNPNIRVLLIRDASLLDSDAMATLAQWAAEHDAQLWIERVEDGGATVVIEDGMVVEQPVAEAKVGS
jgi:hypothetical protein